MFWAHSGSIPCVVTKNMSHHVTKIAFLSVTVISPNVSKGAIYEALRAAR